MHLKCKYRQLECLHIKWLMRLGKTV
jgi:hypothetical protein